GAVAASPDWLAPASVQAKVTTTSWLVHVPAAYGTTLLLLSLVVADADATGLVRSMSIPEVEVPKVVTALFPTASEHVPVTVEFVVGPATCCGAVSVCTSFSVEIGVQANETVTAWLVQVPAV